MYAGQKLRISGHLASCGLNCLFVGLSHACKAPREQALGLCAGSSQILVGDNMGMQPFKKTINVRGQQLHINPPKHLFLPMSKTGKFRASLVSCVGIAIGLCESSLCYMDGDADDCSSNQSLTVWTAVKKGRPQ